MRSFVLLLLAIIMCHTASAQYGTDFHHMYGMFAKEMPMELFTKNMRDHKVKSITRKSALTSERNTDGYMEFDTDGNLVFYKQSSSHHTGTKYYYDKHKRVIKYRTTSASSLDTGNYTVLTYHPEFKHIPMAQKLYNPKGKLISTDITREPKKIKDTFVLIERRNETVTTTKSWTIGDTTYSYDDEEPKRKKDAEIDFDYAVFSKGKILQHGKLKRTSRYDDEKTGCKAPLVPAAIDTIRRNERELMKAELRKLAQEKRNETDDEDEGIYGSRRFSEESINEYIDMYVSAMDEKKTFVPQACYSYNDKGQLLSKKSSYYKDDDIYTYNSDGTVATANEVIYHYDEKGLLTALYTADNEMKFTYTFHP